jgi:hypothetical protein
MLGDRHTDASGETLTVLVLKPSQRALYRSPRREPWERRNIDTEPSPEGGISVLGRQSKGGSLRDMRDKASHYLLEYGILHKQEELPESRV